jgi:mannose-6-phosphate isomerase-like protein (cupin superfamily)
MNDLGRLLALLPTQRPGQANGGSIMVKRTESAATDNVIYLFADRLRGRDAAAPPASHDAEPQPCRRHKEEVFFIRRGVFQCMINGAVGVARAGDFVRIGHGLVHGFVDIGDRPGLMLSHNFPAGVDSGLLSAIGAAIPQSAQEFPKPGTAEFCGLCTIAKRWGVRLDGDDAAA